MYQTLGAKAVSMEAMKPRQERLIDADHHTHFIANVKTSKKQIYSCKNKCIKLWNQKLSPWYGERWRCIKKDRLMLTAT